jgi:hypothetical protein
MASYGVSIVLPLPTAGQVSWDGPLNDLLQQVIDVLAQRVTVDGLNVSAALDMQGHALVDATAIEFVTNGDPGVANSIYYSAGGELFVRDGSNRAVQLTSGGVVNVAGSGGFGGDYASSNQNGASFSNSTGAFTFTTTGGTTYATVEHGELKVHAGSSANSVGLKVPSSLTTYELTLPGALPAGQQSLVTCDITGGLNYRLSASFTESVPVSNGTPVVSAGGLSYSQLQGWSFGTGDVLSIGIPYTVGDRIDSVLFGANNPVTGTLVHVSDTGGNAVIARLSFNSVSAGLRTMAAGAATLTGTLPFTPPGTGSLQLNLQPGSGSPLGVYSVYTTGMRKLIS